MTLLKSLAAPMLTVVLLPGLLACATAQEPEAEKRLDAFLFNADEVLAKCSFTYVIDKTIISKLDEQKPPSISCSMGRLGFDASTRSRRHDASVYVLRNGIEKEWLNHLSELKVGKNYFAAGDETKWPSSNNIYFEFDPFGIALGFPSSLFRNECEFKIGMEKLSRSELLFHTTSGDNLVGVWLAPAKNSVLLLEFDSRYGGMPSRVENWRTRDVDGTQLNKSQLTSWKEVQQVTKFFAKSELQWELCNEKWVVRKCESREDNVTEIFRFTYLLSDWTVGEVPSEFLDEKRHHQMNPRSLGLFDIEEKVRLEESRRSEKR